MANNIATVLIQEISQYGNIPEWLAMGQTCKAWHKVIQEYGIEELHPAVKEQLKEIFGNLSRFYRLPKLPLEDRCSGKISVLIPPPSRSLMRARLNHETVELFARLRNRGALEWPYGHASLFEELWQISTRSKDIMRTALGRSSVREGRVVGQTGMKCNEADGKSQMECNKNWIIRLLHQKSCGLKPIFPGHDGDEIGPLTVTSPSGEEMSRVVFEQPFKPLTDVPSEAWCQIQ